MNHSTMLFNVGNAVFKIVVASAVISYNDGETGLLSDSVLNLDITLKQVFIKCVKVSNRKSTDKAENDRKKQRAARKGYED